MREEIGTKDGLLDICYDEYPSESASKSEIKGEGPGTNSQDGSAIHCL